MRKLDGKEEKEILKLREIEEDEESNEEVKDLTKQEVVLQVRKLKLGKAVAEDTLENEVWKYMPNEIGEVFMKIIQKMWKEGNMPEQWKRGVICPIFKKGEKTEIGNYRGVTVASTAYKIYTGILNERLMKEIDDKL